MEVYKIKDTGEHVLLLAHGKKLNLLLTTDHRRVLIPKDDLEFIEDIEDE